MRSVVFSIILILFSQTRDIPAIQSIIPWTNCSTWTDQMSIHTVTTDVWPPIRSRQLLVSVDGMAKESFIYGQYNKTIVYRGYALPSIFGSLEELGIRLPTSPGPLKWIIWNTTIPEVAPAGKYELIIKAREQDQAEIFCIQLTFELESDLFTV